MWSVHFLSWLHFSPSGGWQVQRERRLGGKHKVFIVLPQYWLSYGHFGWLFWHLPTVDLHFGHFSSSWPLTSQLHPPSSCSLGNTSDQTDIQIANMDLYWIFHCLLDSIPMVWCCYLTIVSILNIIPISSLSFSGDHTPSIWSSCVIFSQDDSNPVAIYGIT